MIDTCNPTLEVLLFLLSDDDDEDDDEDEDDWFSSCRVQQQYSSCRSADGSTHSSLQSGSRTPGQHRRRNRGAFGDVVTGFCKKSVSSTFRKFVIKDQH